MASIAKIYYCSVCREHYEVKYLIAGDKREPLNELTGEDCPTCTPTNKENS